MVSSLGMFRVPGGRLLDRTCHLSFVASDDKALCKMAGVLASEGC